MLDNRIRRRNVKNTERILRKSASWDAFLFLKQSQDGTCLWFEVGQAIELGFEAIELGSDLAELLLQVLLLIWEQAQYSLKLLLDLSTWVGDNPLQAILHRVQSLKDIGIFRWPEKLLRYVISQHWSSFANLGDSGLEDIIQWFGLHRLLLNLKPLADCSLAKSLIARQGATNKIKHITFQIDNHLFYDGILILSAHFLVLHLYLEVLLRELSHIDNIFKLTHIQQALLLCRHLSLFLELRHI